MLEMIKKFATAFKEENELLKEGKIEEAIEKKAESVALLEELAKQAEENQADEGNQESENAGEGENGGEEQENENKLTEEAIEKVAKMDAKFDELLNRVETLEKMKGESKQIQKKQTKDEDNLDSFWDFS